MKIQLIKSRLLRDLPASILFLLSTILTVQAVSADVPAFDLQAANANWIEIESEHFRFVSNRDEAFTEAMIRDLENLSTVIRELFPAGTYDEPVPTIFYLFSSAESAVPYSLSNAAARGFFQPTPLANYAAFFGGDGYFAARSIQQQYLHTVIRLNQPTAPAWVRYGLAAFYGTFERNGQGARFGLPIREYLTWLTTLSGQKWIPFETLIGLEAPPSTEKESLGFFAQSWLLVHYLLTGGEGEAARVVRYVEAVDQGMSSHEAFAAHISKDPPALRKMLLDYVAAPRFRIFRFLGTPKSDTTLHIRTLSKPDVHAVLGELVSATQADANALAAAHFDAAIAVDAEHPGAHTGRAQLAIRAGDLVSAITHLERAAAVDTEDARIAFLLGDTRLDRLAGRAPTTDDERALLHTAIDDLERATAIEPRFAEAWARLGFALGFLDDREAEATQALEVASTLLPGRVDIAWNRLLAHARAGQRTEAEGLVAQIERLEASDEMLARASETLVQMAYRDAAALVRETRLEEALPLLARVLGETTDPNLRASVEALLPKLIPVAQHNRFAARYLEALDLVRQGAFDEALTVIDALAPKSASPRQTEALTILRAAAASLSAAGE